MTIGERVQALRKNKKITLRELSKNVNISISFLSDIENNRSNPSVEKLKSIATGLDTTVSYLLGEEAVSSSFLSISDNSEGYKIRPSIFKKYESCIEGLPLKAIREIENYIEYICSKYSRK